MRVGERDLLHISDRELVIYRRQEVGFVWQSTSRNLVPYLNVRDNIELPMAIAKAPRSQRRQRSGELLEAMHMADKAERYPDQLSGGEQQRVAIGVALANHPPPAVGRRTHRASWTPRWPMRFSSCGGR